MLGSNNSRTHDSATTGKPGKPAAVFLPSSARSALAVLGAVTALTAGADEATKRLGAHACGTALAPVLRVVCTRNTGVAFGLLAGHPTIVTVVDVLAVVGVLFLAVRVRAAGRAAVWGLLVGGATANLADRLASGYVVDWLHVTGYPPSFNLADVAVRVSVVLLVVTGWPSWPRLRNRRVASPGSRAEERPVTGVGGDG